MPCPGQQVATQNNDVQLVDFVESEFLVEQVKLFVVLNPRLLIWLENVNCQENLKESLWAHITQARALGHLILCTNMFFH